MSNSAKANIQSIKVLSPQLANQIAAGEVVERPASVVKELVENSLDAQATKVHIEIDQGGQKRILIRDNGKGIVKDELQLALSRHATSKISDISDLDNITSMGFRGEALASISSVSRLTLTSKPVEQAEAWQATTEGQDMRVDILPAAHPDGTSIEVLDLFFNTPARRKFLRSGKTELQHIENILKRLALTRFDVQFSLQHNNKQIFKYPSCKSLAKRVEQVCGKSMLESTVAVNYTFEDISLHGWCSELGAGLATRDHQYTFVNGRMMRDKLLSHALRQVFEDTLAPQCFASYVLFIDVPPDQLDVNVHPAKHEVRFHQARKVHDVVFKGVTEALSASIGLSSALGATPAHEQVNHDYILPLDRSGHQASLNDYSVTQNIGGASSAKTARYNAPSVSQAEKQANHAFYQSTQQHNSHNSANPPIDNSNTQNTRAFLLHAPYVLFSESDSLKALHIRDILCTLVLQRVIASSASQPLLMPVSIALPDNVSEASMVNICADLYDVGVLIDNRVGKLVLKQVPSTLRQLPWAAVFSPFIEYISLHQPSSDDVNARFSEALVKAWLVLLEQNQTLSYQQVDAWMLELNEESRQNLLNKFAGTLDIEQGLTGGSNDLQ